MIWTFDKSCIALAAYFGNALSVLGGRQPFAGVTSEHERPRRVVHEGNFTQSSITLTAPAKLEVNASNRLNTLETPNSPWRQKDARPHS